MRITLLCTDGQHPVNSYIEQWIKAMEGIHDVTLARCKQDLPGGDILFLVSCSEIIGADERAAYGASLVLHASDLPRGRGWSPHIWQVINGATEITLSLLEAEDQVDSGRIWLQKTFAVPKHALWDEINARLFEAEIELINQAINEFGKIIPYKQDDTVAPDYYPRRKPSDSRIDPAMSIASQFDLIRVCDPARYPAFFELHGHTYKIRLEKSDEKPDQD